MLASRNDQPWKHLFYELNIARRMSIRSFSALVIVLTYFSSYSPPHYYTNSFTLAQSPAVQQIRQAPRFFYGGLLY